MRGSRAPSSRTRWRSANLTRPRLDSIHHANSILKSSSPPASPSHLSPNPFTPERMPRKEPYATALARAASTHDIPAALAEQARLASLVHIPPDSEPYTLPRTVAGLDISYEVGTERVVAAAVLLDVETLEVLAEATVSGVQRFPYVPGLLAFREVPLLLEALGALYRKMRPPSGEQSVEDDCGTGIDRRQEDVIDPGEPSDSTDDDAKCRPDLLLCDGQGLAHPARCGLASHLGVLTGLPSIGCAKSHYIGSYDEPGPRRGDRAEMFDGGEVVGHVLRTQDGIKPVFVSPGHLVSRRMACEVVLRMCGRYRVPEGVRAADGLSRRVLRETRGTGGAGKEEAGVEGGGEGERGGGEESEEVAGDGL